MASVNRATLPQAFLDSINAAMMLPTPEPQYWFANHAIGGKVRGNRAFPFIAIGEKLFVGVGFLGRIDRTAPRADPFRHADCRLVAIEICWAAG